MAALIDLDEPSSRDAAIVGAKAAGLARARAAGLPVLTGKVLPTCFGSAAVVAAESALEERGSGGARLDILSRPVSPEIVGELAAAVRAIGPPVVVRSSSRVEAEAIWAGAFSSFDGIDAGDVEKAVRGVWASAFTPDVLRRCEQASTQASQIGLAVLIQKQVEPGCGGTALVGEDDVVTIHASRRGPSVIVSGFESGVVATVDPAGTIGGAEAVAELGTGLLTEAAALARQVRDRLGDNHIEWARTGEAGAVVLLQTDRRLSPSRPTARSSGSLEGDVVAALRLARLVQDYQGGLGERLVLPWAASLSGAPTLGDVAPSQSPARDFGRAVDLSRRLTADAWRSAPAVAVASAEAAFAAARGDDPGPALAQIADLRGVDVAAGQEVLERLHAVALAASARGLIRSPAELWALSFDAAEAVAHGRPQTASPPSTRIGPGRWEPFVCGVVLACGDHVRGRTIVPGAGAGPATYVSNPHDHPAVPERSVIFADRPHPALSALLWGAAALVVGAGSAGAHLFDVATSLGVPTVTGVDVRRHAWAATPGSPGPLTAVDGEAGTVALLRDDEGEG